MTHLAKQMISSSLPHKLPDRPLQAGSCSSPLSAYSPYSSSIFSYSFSSPSPLPFHPPLICFFHLFILYFFLFPISLSLYPLSPPSPPQEASHLTTNLRQDPHYQRQTPSLHHSLLRLLFILLFPLRHSPSYITHMTDVSNPPAAAPPP